MKQPFTQNTVAVSLLLLLLMLLSATAGWAQSATTEEDIVTKLAENAYAIRHKRAAAMGAGSGNTTVIIGERDVLVVDSCLIPLITRSDIALIKKWTDKPVRYLVNTHWHGDHTWGNGVYSETFPGITIIAHHKTAEMMQGYLPHFLPRNVAYPEKLKRMLETGQEEDGKPLTEARKTELKEDLPHAELRAAEFKNVVTQPANLTFDHELNLDLGNRPVQIRYFGRGNTSGDIVVYLPWEKVLAAGDLLVYPMPYLVGGFPSEWSKTLEHLSQLGAQTIVPGHGAILTGNDASNYLNLVKELLATVAGAVRAEMFKLGEDSENVGVVLEAVRDNPAIPGLRERFGEENKTRFDNGLARLVTAAQHEGWGEY